MEAKVRTVFACEEAHEKADKIKIAMLLSAIGPDSLERYNHFTWPEPVEGDEENKVPSKDVYKDVLSRFEQEFAGMKRVVFSRFKFLEHSRSEGQGFDEYLTELKTFAKACEFLENDNMIRDKIVFSMKEKSLQERLLREVDLTLKRTVDLRRSAEITKREVQSVKSAEPSVNEVRTRAKNKSSPGEHNNRCGRCGTVHGFKKCPAWGKLCLKCHGKNHFKNYCKTKTGKEIIESEESDDEYFMDTTVVGNIDKTDN